LLQRIQALDGQGDLTAHGKALAEMPLPPRLAHMVVRAAASGQAGVGAEVAAVLTEQGLGGRDVDLRRRLENLGRDRSPRAKDAQALAERWARAAGKPSGATPLDDGLMLAEAYPERVAGRAASPANFSWPAAAGSIWSRPIRWLARPGWRSANWAGATAATASCWRPPSTRSPCATPSPIA
jgi:ATP-dependent helicase HrpB